MKKENKITMEINNISYIERPHAFLKFKRAGFSIEDIQITRINSSHYNMIAIKYL